MNTELDVANALLEINAISFSPKKPFTFNTGLISPVYVDNRRIPFYPQRWQIIFEGFQRLIEDSGIQFDMFAGVETAGIPHSSALGLFLKRPSVFVRKKVKEYGTKRLVEGGDVKRKRVLLIEDHVSTGKSSLAAITAIRKEGAIVHDCLSITSYEFPEVKKAFKAEKVRLHTLTSFAHIFEQAILLKRLKQEEIEVVQDWLHDPKGWAKRRKFA